MINTTSIELKMKNNFNTFFNKPYKNMDVAIDKYINDCKGYITIEPNDNCYASMDKIIGRIKSVDDISAVIEVYDYEITKNVNIDDCVLGFQFLGKVEDEVITIDRIVGAYIELKQTGNTTTDRSE